MRNILKNILHVLTTKEKKQLSWIIIMDIIISAFDILSLALLLATIQLYIQPYFASRLSFLPAWLKDPNSLWPITFFLLFFSIKNLCGYLLTRTSYRFMNTVAVRISASNLSNYQQGNFSEYVQNDSSVYLRKICYQPFEFAQYMLAGLQQVITQLTLMLITLAAIIFFNARIFALLMILLLPPVIVVFWLIRKKLSALKKNIQESNELSFRYVLEALKGYVESNLYDRNDFFLARFVKVRRQFSNALFESIALQSLPGRVIELFAVLGLFILVIVSVWQGNQDQGMLLTIGAFMAAAYKLIPGIVKLINTMGQMRAYELSLNNLDATKNKFSAKNSVSAAEPLRSVQLKNICFEYGGKLVLNDFSMTISPGDFIGISGKSGLGKTTVLNILLGFLQPASGGIYFNNNMVDSNTIKNYWPSMAYLKQQSFLINDTVVKNITLEEDNQLTGSLLHASKVSGVDTLTAASPEGLEKIISENGKNISGGQQQRICIARVLYKNASLLLLDEPFSELDATSTTELLQYFKELTKQGLMVVMITHDKNSLAFCNKTILLDEG